MGSSIHVDCTLLNLYYGLQILQKMGSSIHVDCTLLNYGLLLLNYGLLWLTNTAEDGVQYSCRLYITELILWLTNTAEDGVQYSCRLYITELWLIITELWLIMAYKYCRRWGPVFMRLYITELILWLTNTAEDGVQYSCRLYITELWLIITELWLIMAYKYCRRWGPVFMRLYITELILWLTNTAEDGVQYSCRLYITELWLIITELWLIMAYKYCRRWGPVFMRLYITELILWLTNTAEDGVQYSCRLYITELWLIITELWLIMAYKYCRRWGPVFMRLYITELILWLTNTAEDGVQYSCRLYITELWLIITELWLIMAYKYCRRWGPVFMRLYITELILWLINTAEDHLNRITNII